MNTSTLEPGQETSGETSVQVGESGIAFNGTIHARISSYAPQQELFAGECLDFELVSPLRGELFCAADWGLKQFVKPWEVVLLRPHRAVGIASGRGDNSPGCSVLAVRFALHSLPDDWPPVEEWPLFAKFPPGDPGRTLLALFQTLAHQRVVTIRAQGPENRSAAFTEALHSQRWLDRVPSAPPPSNSPINPILRDATELLLMRYVRGG